MNALEIKGGLYDMISGIHDEELLLKLKDIVADVIDQDLKQSDFWDELSTKQQAELDEALQESKKKKNLVSHQEVIDKYKRWQKK